jgi:hypothetical protein
MDHYVLVIYPGDKDLITPQIAARNGKTILFVKTQRGTDRLADNLAKAGVPVSALHGGKSQAVRTRTLKLFKEQENAVLVAKVLVLYANLFVCNAYWWATASKIFVGLVAQLVRAND